MRNTGYNGTRPLLILVSILWVIGCTPSIPVQSSFDRTTNFQTYRTFDWYPAEAENNSRAGYDPEVDRRIKTAVGAELVKKGIRPDAGSPDFLIAYDVALDTAIATNEAMAPGFGYGYGYWFGYRFNYDGRGIPHYRSISDYPAGTLIIDFIDPETRALLWRGSAEGGIVPTQTDERKIRRSVTNILLQYPPGEPAMPTR